MSEGIEVEASRNARANFLKAEAAYKKAAQYETVNDKTGFRQFSELGDKLYKEGMAWLRR